MPTPSVAMPLTRTTALLVAVAIWACCYLPCLGTMEIQGNEAKRILPAIHMIESGNWLTPQLTGVTYVNKPPLIYWMVAGSLLATDSRAEWAARLPSVLCILLFVVLLVLMPSSSLSVAARLIAAVAFMTTVSFIEKGRQIEIEASFVAMTGMATVWWLNAWSDRRGQWATWFVPCLILGTGLLLKGPLILLFFYAVVMTVLLATRRGKDALCIAHVTGIVVMFAMLLWWVAYITLTSEKAKAGLSYEVGSRFVPKQINVVEWIGTWFKVLIDFLPWAILLPFLWTRTWVANIPEQQRSIFKACRLALVLCFVLVNAMPGTRSRYSMPLFPLAAILLGWLLAAQDTRPMVEKIWRFLARAVFPVCLVAAIIGMLVVPTGLVFVLIERFHGPHWATAVAAADFILPGCVVLVAAAAAGLAYRLRHHFRGVVNLSLITGIALALLTLGFMAYAMPIVEKFSIRRPAGASINATVPAGQKLYMYNFAYEPFLYYVRPEITVEGLGTNQIPAGARYLLTENKSLELLKAQPDFTSRTARVALDLRYKKDTYTLFELGQ